MRRVNAGLCGNLAWRLSSSGMPVQSALEIVQARFVLCVNTAAKVAHSPCCFQKLVSWYLIENSLYHSKHYVSINF